jgi:predicted acylesterase/phospholipase RssA
MTIKHLVISGGGPIMIQILAAIQELENNKYLNINEIESIYGTSAGAILAVMFSLNFDWQTLNDYIIKRPWQDVFCIKVQNILDSYTKKGIFDTKTVEKCFKPLLDAKDISLDITLEDFYKVTNKELHIFAFEINDYKIVDISYKTHPNLKLLNAVQMSCALPVLMTPVFFDDKCFIDGGVACNYPLNFCIESGKNPDETLGFKNKYSDDKIVVNKESTLLDYILNFLFKAVFNVHNNYTQPIIKNEVICDTSYLSFDTLREAISNIDVRKDLFDKGKKVAIQFLELQNSI